MNHTKQTKELREDLFSQNIIYRLADKNLLGEQAFDEWLDQLGDW